MPQVATPPRGAHYRVAGFWRRTVAGAVDGLVLLPLVIVFGGVTSLVTGSQLPRLGELGFGYLVHLAVDGGMAGAVALAMSGLVVLLYLLIFDVTLGQTPGMRVLRMRVIDSYGDAPSVPRALVRIVALFVSVALFSLGWLWIGFSREKRGLHDLLARTYVVLADPVAAAPLHAAGVPSP